MDCVYFKQLLTRKNSKSQRENSATPKKRLQFSHVLLVLSGMVLMELLHHLFFPGIGFGSKSTDHKAQSQVKATTKIPAWGKLEYTPLALDRPEGHFTNLIDPPLESRWILHRSSEQQLADFFNSLPLKEPSRSFLLDHSHWQPITNGYAISPPPEVVIGLDPDARRALYTELAQDPENAPQCMPFTFRTGGFDEWFSECGLSAEKISLVRKLSYTNEENLSFADAAVFREVSTPDETLCLLKGLWRVSTFLMRIRITPETDVDALIGYWGKAGPARSYKPLLESMSRVPEGESISISYFLPPFARLRLFTYPEPNDTNLLAQDCFWSAMNFFNEKPDSRLFEPAYKDHLLSTEYGRVLESDRQFGDLLLLLGTNNTALHMCVYLADDVVFTKNGANVVQPWVLMKIHEMLGIYNRLRPFKMVYYRRKNPPSFNSVSSYPPVVDHSVD